MHSIDTKCSITVGSAQAAWYRLTPTVSPLLLAFTQDFHSSDSSKKEWEELICPERYPEKLQFFPRPPTYWLDHLKTTPWCRPESKWSSFDIFSSCSFHRFPQVSSSLCVVRGKVLWACWYKRNLNMPNAWLVFSSNGNGLQFLLQLHRALELTQELGMCGQGGGRGGIASSAARPQIGGLRQ